MNQRQQNIRIKANTNQSIEGTYFYVLKCFHFNTLTTSFGCCSSPGVLLSHRGRPWCRCRRCTTSPQRRRTNSASASATSSKCWIALTHRGGKGGCGGEAGCFLPTTRHRCEKHGALAHPQTGSAAACVLLNTNTEQSVTRRVFCAACSSRRTARQLVLSDIVHKHAATQRCACAGLFLWTFFFI